MDQDNDDRQELLDFLKEHGWDEEKSNRFLNGRAGVQVLQIPGRCLLDVLQEACQEGIPIGDINVSFLVPDHSREAFRRRAEKAVAKQGGFVLTREEKALMDASGSSKIEVC